MNTRKAWVVDRCSHMLRRSACPCTLRLLACCGHTLRQQVHRPKGAAQRTCPCHAPCPFPRPCLSAHSPCPCLAGHSHGPCLAGHSPCHGPWARAHRPHTCGRHCVSCQAWTTAANTACHKENMLWQSVCPLTSACPPSALLPQLAWHAGAPVTFIPPSLLSPTAARPRAAAGRQTTAQGCACGTC